MEEHQYDASSHATNQKLVAGVLIWLLYVHGLDLSMGDAGTVLVKGRGTKVRHALPDSWGMMEDVLCFTEGGRVT